ncbi:hypothetical protein Tco_0360990 [Tanacetum coccineum]
MSTVMASCFPATNNQLRISSNPRNQAIIQDGRVTVQQGEGHMERQCTQPTRLRNSAWFKEKILMVQAHKSGQVLDEEQLGFLTDDLDAYDSDCDDISSAKAVLMANLSSYSLDVLFEQKARIPELKRRYFEDYYFEDQYALSIQEDDGVSTPAHTKDHKGMKRNTPYPRRPQYSYSR